MELEAEVKRLIHYIKFIGLKIPTRKPSHKHVGAIIADAVLQGGGHRYETQVKPRVERIRDNYPAADNISGLSSLLKTQSAQALLNWSGKDEQKRFHQTVSFFENEQINTFDDLRKWLESEANRDRLVTKSNRVDKAGIPKISNATADYYRVLVRLPDAVKVDSRVKEFLRDAGITLGKYEYKELRTIVQLAAKQLGKRPIDLDSAIWNYQGKGNDKGGEMAGTIKKAGQIRAQWMNEAKQFCKANGLQNECTKIEDMDWPPNWHLKSDGNDDKPFWWFRPRAVKDNFLRLWESRSINARPQNWKDPYRKFEALSVYLTTREGIDWQNRHKPDWLPPSEAQVTISLPADKKAQLEEIAKEFGVKDGPALARIWILEHLRQLH